ncbi:hypothetical protein D187_000649 [Cystobacter fuscus DSM 2262]|uniref:DUF5916 domain-containing protein n=1 Tax=Cystobacter fuscus (strain ATCC 25194 / DSM 2262 / NBRC 100088 / M29) TaxID=1242864 RepID=S9QV60_CYSF2|nr:DUF5916 domain-containing protein [Cystobacter fuscus]EPX65224.1 hypothetical protein D187_000649 [Cystobacter fuscus DSM 2262]
MTTVLLALSARASAQTETPARLDDMLKSMTAARIASPPAIDGRLDDEAWKTLVEDERFTQAFPQEGAPPSERTSVRIGYDDHALYIGIRVYESDPGQIVSRLAHRDRETETDWVKVLIDSRHDRTTGYSFGLSAAGGQLDGMIFDDTEFTSDWDAVWNGAVAHDPWGWSAEFQIPFQVLRFSEAASMDWGLQVERYVSRNKERVQWALVPSTVRGKVSRLGTLRGLSSIQPHRSFEFRPFLVTRFEPATETEGLTLREFATPSLRRLAINAGVDLKVGLARSLTLDATINPDFAQLEADQAVLNLGPNETYFPEKRPFFLEGLDLFDSPLTLFYSRRIGRAVSGLSPGDPIEAADGGLSRLQRTSPTVPIWGAAKLTGQISENLSIAALGAITGAEEATLLGANGTPSRLSLVSARSHGVLRGRYSTGNATYLGWFLTAVNRLQGTTYLADLAHDAYAQGVDGQWQSVDGRWRLGGQLALSQRVGGPSHRTALGRGCSDTSLEGCIPITRDDGTRVGPGDLGGAGLLSAEYEGTHWLAELSYQVFSPRFDIRAMGFQNDFDAHRLVQATGYRETRPGALFQNFEMELQHEATITFAGVPSWLTSELTFQGQYRNFMQQSLSLGVGYPSWRTRETHGDGGRLQRPAYTYATAKFQSDTRKVLELSTSLLGYVDEQRGWGGSLEGRVSARVLPQLELELAPILGWDANDIRFFDCRDDAGGNCNIETITRHYRIGRLDSGSLSFLMRLAYTISPRLSLQAYAQLFMSQAEFSRYSEATTTREHPAISFGLLRSSSFNGDLDGDGLQDDDFENALLNANVVLRWEFIPGSTLMGVYSRTQSASRDLRGGPPHFRASTLEKASPEDRFFLKVAFYKG